ncbi:uncharacterized protein [Ptychodera flava]|uniref:uncharacterized protein n=1 Tax=Ptychodera flava TaxID=63121 RepID=UPI00396A67E1
MDPQKHQTDWDEHLSLATFAYRSSVHPATGETPNMLMFGRELYYPLDMAITPLKLHDNDQGTDYVSNLRERIEIAHEHARSQLTSTARRQKKMYDRFATKSCHNVGDFVWLKDERRKKGYSPKLQLAYEGPYLVIGKLSDLVYRIQYSPKSKPKIVHYEKLKRYQGEPLNGWLDKVKILPIDERVQVGKPSDHDQAKPDLGNKTITPSCDADNTVTENSDAVEMKGQSDISTESNLKPDVPLDISSEPETTDVDNVGKGQIKCSDDSVCLEENQGDADILEVEQCDNGDTRIAEDFTEKNKIKDQPNRYPTRARKQINHNGFGRLSKAVSQVWKELTS